MISSCNGAVLQRFIQSCYHTANSYVLSRFAGEGIRGEEERDAQECFITCRVPYTTLSLSGLMPVTAALANTQRSILCGWGPTTTALSPMVFRVFE
jgi:hypothetical protein